MRTIHKYKIEINKEIQIIDMPENLRFLHVEYLMPRRSLYMWAEVPAEITQRKFPRRIRVFSTGDGIPNSARHIGTCVDQYLPESYHVYELQD